MSKKYAVAVTLTEHKPSGVLNIITHLFVLDAVSADEARGKANREASWTNKNHSIFTTIVTAVDDEDDGQSQENQK